MQFAPHNWAELIAALAATYCYIVQPALLNRVLIIFLWLVFLVELTGLLTINYPYFKAAMYNIFNVVQMLFYLFFLFRLFENGRTKIAIKRWMVVVVVFGLLNFLFIQGIYTFNSYTRILGTFLIVLFSLLSLLKITNNPSKNISGYIPAMVAICCFMAFFAVNACYEVFYNYMLREDASELFRVFKLVNHKMNLVLYGGFTVALLLERFLVKHPPLHHARVV